MNEQEEVLLIPFALEHATLSEGGKHKLHILDCVSEKVLCGINTENLPCSSGTLFVITEQWLQQPDTDNELCKKCKKSAIKIITTK